jgi:hypothetical protein
MIQFLFYAYGNITPIDLNANEKMTKEQWYPSTHTIYMFSNIQDGVDREDAGNTPST